MKQGTSFFLCNENDTDMYIRVNNLKPVTNPIAIKGDVPTTDGLFSYEIFGTSQAARMGTPAYIDLKGKYLPGHLALKLKAYDRKLSDLLFSNKRFILDKDGNLIADEENGETGPAFLYEIWDKYKPESKKTILTKEVEESFSKKREDLFVDKIIILPAGLRDFTLGTKQMRLKELNDTYTLLLNQVLTVDMYADSLGFVRNLTQSRIQAILVEIYEIINIGKVKGSPSKYGFLKKSVASKNPKYTSRSVISAMNYNTETWKDIPVKYKETGIPIAQVCSTFFPFVAYELKQFFDNEFLRGGKYPFYTEDNNIEYRNIEESYDYEEIQKMINRFIKSPYNRFDKVKIPGKHDKNYYMAFTGRFIKEDKKILRAATLTDVLYLACLKAVKSKIIDTTRFPLESINGQFPGRVAILTTTRTHSIMIGEEVYPNYPHIESYKDPINAFVDTVQFSHTKLSAIGGDYDGDQTGEKSRFSNQACLDGEKFMNSPGFYLTPGGDFMRSIDKEMVLTAYSITKTDKILPVLSKSPKYAI